MDNGNCFVFFMPFVVEKMTIALLYDAFAVVSEKMLALAKKMCYTF